MIDENMMKAQPGGTGLSLFNKLWNDALDLLFPPRCTGCGKVDTSWCTQCNKELESIPIVPIVKTIDTKVEVLSSGLHLGKLREAIHALKYDNLPTIGKQLSQRLNAVLQYKEWRIDTIVPVPLHTTRLQQRGYNQSQVLGKYLSEYTGIPCVETAVIRQRATQSQVTLNRAERLNNMQDAFIANPHDVAGKNILIVDDVLTTGATLLAISSALKQADTDMIYGLTITTASE